MKNDTKKLNILTNSKILQSLRGVKDIFFPESNIYKYVFIEISKLLESEGFNYIIIPTIEYSELYTSKLENNSNEISQEMYSFLDKKNREIALRPEGTLGVVRSMIQNRLITDNKVNKIFYWGRMFRYERPQKDRKREFTQLGIEIINADGVLTDFHTINIAIKIIKKLEIKNYSLNINFLGEEETKNNYILILKNFIQKLKKDNVFICNSCENKLNYNPLRILDCKTCKKIIKFPKYSLSYNNNDKIYLEEIKKTLNLFNIKYIVEENLVRGLDYYTGLVFEIVNGENNAILGGGRYNNLYKEFANLSLPSIGFAFGIDRVISLLDIEFKERIISKYRLQVFLYSIDCKNIIEDLKLKEELTKNYINTESNLNISFFHKNFINNIKKKYNPKFITILKDKEVKIINLEDDTKTIIEKKDILNYFIHKKNV